MKITGIQIEKILIPLTEPFKVAFGTIEASESVLIKMTTDEGIAGYGEAAPLAFVTGESADGAIVMLREFTKGLLGQDPLRREKVHAIMAGGAHGNTSAKCAVDLAIHDIWGKYAGMPVYKLLGGHSSHVVNDVTIGIGEPEEMARTAKRYTKGLGYTILKVKVGLDPANDLQALRLIREAVGPAVRLRVDCNQGYDVSVAAGMLEKFRDLGVEAVEQCLPDWDIEGAAYLRRKAVGGIKLMLDESIHGPIEAARAAKLDAADVFNIKLMKTGGLYPAEKVNAIAEANGINCMVGCMLETKLGLTAGLSLVAAKQNITEADCDSFMYYKDASNGMVGGFSSDGGVFHLSDELGFGLQVSF